MTKRWWETKKMFKRRWDLDQAIRAMDEAKRLWRIDAIEMKPIGKNGYQMGGLDHFTVEAPSRELAIGKFKTGDRMNWFVIAAQPEKVIGA